jgi:alanyl aminopeptidase
MPELNAKWRWLVALTLVFSMPMLPVFSSEDGISGSVPDTKSQDHATLRRAPPVGRLDDLARPIAYRVDLHIDPHREDFSGAVQMDFSLQRASDHLWMHGRSLRVSDVALVLSDGIQLPVEYQQVLDTGVVRIDFGRRLDAGDMSLHIHYEADFNRSLAGLFKVEEQGDAYVLAKSESIQARNFLPGFDQPGFKAPVSLSLTIPSGQQAIANAPETARRSLANGMDRVTFAATPPMPTYLLSLAVGPFDVVDMAPIAASPYRRQPIPLRGFARRGRADDLRYILAITPQFVRIFEQALAQPYPFRKLDIIAAPQWPSGATELSAAITYREQIVLLDDSAAPGARRRLLGLHAHELAHMWFGNQVTPPWWNDLWLKEGFATWATPMVLSQFEPEAGHDLDGKLGGFVAMGLDSLASTRAIREPVLRNEDIRNAYDAITYRKTQALIHMADSYFGADDFRRALGRYVASFSGGVADAEDFYSSIAAASAEPEISTTFRQFVEQRGVPFFDISLNCSAGKAGTLVFKQSRYRPLGSTVGESNRLWRCRPRVARNG